MLRQSQYKGFLPYRPDPDNELGNWMVSLQAVNLNNYPPPLPPKIATSRVTSVAFCTKSKGEEATIMCTKVPVNT